MCACVCVYGRHCMCVVRQLYKTQYHINMTKLYCWSTHVQPELTGVLVNIFIMMALFELTSHNIPFYYILVTHVMKTMSSSHVLRNMWLSASHVLPILHYFKVSLKCIIFWQHNLTGVLVNIFIMMALFELTSHNIPFYPYWCNMSSSHVLRNTCDEDMSSSHVLPTLTSNISLNIHKTIFYWWWFD